MGSAVLCGQNRARFIKSIQKVSITLNTAANTATATINAVDVNNSIVVWNGMSTSGTASKHMWASVVLTNSTTLTATRNTGSTTYSTTVSVTVIEFYPEVVRSKQSGVMTVSGVATTLAIPEVNLSKTLLCYCGQYYNQAGDTSESPSASLCRLFFDNSTTLKAIRGQTSSYPAYAAWNLIEFI